MDKDIFSERIYVWGTGVFAKKFFAELAQYNELFFRWKGYTLVDNIQGYIDSNQKKQGTIFEGKCVFPPEILVENKNSSCILALSDINEPKEFLCKIFCTNYYVYEDYLASIVTAICHARENIFVNFIGCRINISDGKNSMCLLQDRIKLIDSTFLPFGTKTLLQYIAFSEYLYTQFDRPLYGFMLDMIKEFPSTIVTGFLKWFFGRNIQCVVDAGIKLKTNAIKKKKSTLGICIDRYWGGGIEKVVSLLIEEYVKQGHKVVLFLNERSQEKDWSIPEQVVCHVMKYNVSKDFCLRMQELEQCVKDNQIDVMCFHSGYNVVSTFYEMLFIRMLNIPVILELHSSYPALVRGKDTLADLYGNMYRIASRVIVLSQSDLRYWRRKGCRCSYIQNPISGLLDVPANVAEGRKKEMILWVGRLVQNPKNVLDVVPIMKHVVERYPNAKLKMLGVKERDYDYNLLIEGIEKEGLVNNIELCGYHKDLNPFYREASIFLFTSSYESFSQVILESKQWGLPMVMYEIPWLELTRSQEGYISVPQRDVEAAANAITKLLDDDLYRREIGKSAKASVKRFLEYDVYSAWQNTFNEFSVNNMISSKV